MKDTLAKKLSFVRGTLSVDLSIMLPILEHLKNDFFSLACLDIFIPILGQDLVMRIPCFASRAGIGRIRAFVITTGFLDSGLGRGRANFRGFACEESRLYFFLVNIT